MIIKVVSNLKGLFNSSIVDFETFTDGRARFASD